MSEITIASEIVGMVVALMGVIGGAVPLIQRYRARAIKFQNFIFAIEAAFKDEKLTKPELEHLYKVGRAVLA